MEVMKKYGIEKLWFNKFLIETFPKDVLENEKF